MCLCGGKEDGGGLLFDREMCTNKAAAALKCWRNYGKTVNSITSLSLLLLALFIFYFSLRGNNRSRLE